VRFVFFVNEEPPYFQTERMGSLVYADRARAKNENIIAMISIESIGYYSDEPDSQDYPPGFSLLYPDRGNFIAFVGDFESRDLVKSTIEDFRLGRLLPSEGLAAPFAMPGVGWSDHWSFAVNGYPAVMVTDTAPFRNPHYHTESDRPDTLDYDRMALVVRGLMLVVRILACDSSCAI
jgi:Zn-dependent M28 family amino/carboxypeptidase